ncbi:MAG: glycoside hydrolase [Candidatus Hydrogenedentes bacterium]|nr:glycoside hydrolase [Candidatus Hydrogenedentota bacterium]
MQKVFPYKCKSLLILALSMYFLANPTIEADQNRDFVSVFISGEEGYNTFRIPALLKTKSGALLAFCEGRKESLSDSGDIDLVLKRSLDGGRTWSSLRVIWDDGVNTCGNPCVVQNRDTGEILLLITWNRGDDTEMEIINGKSKDTRRVFITRSVDDGLTWSTPQEITTMAKDPDWTWYATGPGIGIQLRFPPYKGRIVIPCDHANKNDKEWYSHVIFSDDGGKSWKYSQPIGPKTNECQVVEIYSQSSPPPGIAFPTVVDISTPPKLLLNMRNYNRTYECRALSYSLDGGISWSPVEYDTALIEPICQASLIVVKEDPNKLIFSNPADKKERRMMTVKVSGDGGKSWHKQVLVYEGPSAYSCLYQLNSSEVGLLFECGAKSPYEKIVFTKVRFL